MNETRHLILNTEKPALLQDYFFHSNYSQDLNDHFAVLKMAVDILLTEIILILSQIPV